MYVPEKVLRGGAVVQWQSIGLSIERSRVRFPVRPLEFSEILSSISRLTFHHSYIIGTHFIHQSTQKTHHRLLERLSEQLVAHCRLVTRLVNDDMINPTWRPSCDDCKYLLVPGSILNPQHNNNDGRRPLYDTDLRAQLSGHKYMQLNCVYMCTARDFSLSRAVAGTASEDSKNSSYQLRVPSQCEKCN